jgi:glutathione S-transferase
MSKLVLYYAPGTCARVPMITMFEGGIEFEPRLIRFMAGQHRSPEYLAQNPKGKVPLLLVDGQPLTENVAILTFLARQFPAAKVLPLDGDPLHEARVLSDLAWCASGLHPLVTRMRFPQFFSGVPESHRSVWEIAAADMARNFRLIDERLQQQAWMLGDWSALDAYVYWVWFRVTGAGFDGTPYPRYADHARRMEQRASVQRYLALEREAEAQLQQEGMLFRPPPPPPPG